MVLSLVSGAEHPEPLCFLNSWTPGSLGRTLDNMLIARLKLLADSFGVETVANISGQIADIWRKGIQNRRANLGDAFYDAPLISELDVIEGNRELIYFLKSLGDMHGYALLDQITKMMLDILTHPETIPKYREQYFKRIHLL